MSSEVQPQAQVDLPEPDATSAMPIEMAPSMPVAIVDSGRVYFSGKAVELRDRINLYRALRGQVKNPEEMLNVKFAPKEMMLHPVEWVNEDGEQIRSVAVTFWPHEGEPFQIRSSGIFSSVRDLIRLRLCPPFCRDVVLQLVRRPCKTKKDHSYYAFDLIGPYEAPKPAKK